MIRKFVPVNKTVTDFCCVLNFMGMEVPNSVFKCCLASHIHDFKHKMLQILYYEELSFVGVLQVDLGMPLIFTDFQ